MIPAQLQQSAAAGAVTGAGVVADANTDTKADAKAVSMPATCRPRGVILALHSGA